MVSPANIVGSRLEGETLDEKSKYIRFERISEIFTYVALGAGAILASFPYQGSFNPANLYVLFFIILIFALVWFRALPKKYSGKAKNFIYYAATIVFVGLVVNFAGGVQSPIVFLFYLTCLAAVASMGLKEIALFTGLSAFVILCQAFFGDDELPITQSFSLATLHVWGLVSTVIYGWFVFGEEKRAKEASQEAHVERAQEVNKIKDEFVFIISSKLASPVVTLKEYISTALSGKFGSFSSEQKDVLVRTEENSRRLELLVGDLLDLSKLETGKLRLDMEKVNLGDIVGSTLSDFTLKASEKKMSILYDNPKEKVLVKADSARLHEVIANLVDNSIKYSPTGSRVKVRFFKKGNTAQLDVEDTGQGISEEDQKHLFEKFYRAGDDKGKVKGSGLGLFISRQLIIRQGGNIWFKSKLGAGSTFSFSLPLA
jgi:signal transduction histidine kinase